MAPGLIFRFFPKESPVHSLDARFKILILVSLSISIFRASWTALILLLILSLFLALLGKLPLKYLFRDLKGILFLFLLIFLGFSFSTPGEPSFFPGFSWQGMELAILFCLRLFIVILGGNLFLSTTSIPRIQAALRWYFRLIPFLPAEKLAVLLGLILNLFPVLLEEYGKISEAQAARCFHRVRNPLKRILATAFPLLVNTLTRGNTLAMAMDSRCFTEKRGFASLRAGLSDWIFGIGSALLPPFLVFLL